MCKILFKRYIKFYRRKGCNKIEENKFNPSKLWQKMTKRNLQILYYQLMVKTAMTLILFQIILTIILQVLLLNVLKKTAFK
jgi:hypothetical protein